MTGRFTPLLQAVANSGVKGVIGVVAGAIGLALMLQQVYDLYITGRFGHDSVIWAATTTLFVVITGIVLVFCSLNHQNLTDEIDRMATHSEQLEESLLNKRQSSRSKG